MKIFFANKNMTFIEWKYFYQILLLFGNHINGPTFRQEYTTKLAKVTQILDILLCTMYMYCITCCHMLF